MTTGQQTRFVMGNSFHLPPASSGIKHIHFSWINTQLTLSVTTGRARRVAIQCATGPNSIHSLHPVLGESGHLWVSPKCHNDDSSSQQQSIKTKYRRQTYFHMKCYIFISFDLKLATLPGYCPESGMWCVIFYSILLHLWLPDRHIRLHRASPVRHINA